MLGSAGVTGRRCKVEQGHRHIDGYMLHFIMVSYTVTVSSVGSSITLAAATLDGS